MNVVRIHLIGLLLELLYRNLGTAISIIPTEDTSHIIPASNPVVLPCLSF